MSRFFHLHPDNPQHHLIRQLVELVKDGAVIVYPTDSSYALGCHIGDKRAMESIRTIRRVDAKHNFTLVCRDLSEIASYARVDNRAYRMLKALTPGPYTFILKATREVPRRLQNPRRKTIGLRVPENRIAQSLLEVLNEPLMSSTLILPGEEMPLTDSYEIQELIGHQVDAVIDGGYCGFEPTTVVDLAGEEPVVLRRGRGAIDIFQHIRG